MLTQRLTRMLVAAVPCLAGCAAHRHRYPDVGTTARDLASTVEHLVAVSPSRSYENPAAMQTAAQYVFDRFRVYGLTPELQEFQVGTETYANVSAVVGPTQGPRVVVGAHYDVCGDQPGADDNASAVAGLLEVARFARENELDLPYRTEFVAFALEEPPFFGTPHMGSHVHASALHRDREPVRAMICLEMIGFFSDKPKSQRYPFSLMRLFYPGRGNFIAVVGNCGSFSLVNEVAGYMRRAAIPVRTLKAPRWVPGVDFSDHRNYWALGYDAVMVTDTAFYRNPNYHEVTDTPDTLDFDRMLEVTRGVCWTVLNLR